MTQSQAAQEAADEARGSGFAAELERDQAHRDKAKSVQPLRRLVPYILRYPALLAAFSLFLVLASGLTLLLPAAFRLVVDCGFAGDVRPASCASLGEASGLEIYFMAGMGVAVLLGLASAFRFYFISRLGERVVADLRQDVFGHLLSLDARFYANTRTGEVLSRLTTDTTLIQTVVGSSISVALRTVATTTGALILMVVVSWQLALFVLALGPLILGPILLFGRRIQRLSRVSQDNLADASARAGETLQAIQTVQAFTREGEESQRFAKAVEMTFVSAMRRISVRSIMTALIFSVILTGLIAVLWFGAVQVQAGAITPGAMTQFVMYAFVAVSGVGMLTETYTEMMRAAGATERLMELLAARASLPIARPVATLDDPVQGAIVFEGVSFAYPGREAEPALRDVGFAASPGETVAIVGPSGAGKTTLFQLLLRLHDPLAGRICLDGRDIKQLDPQALRAKLAIVQQNAPLFSGSVADNIRFGRPGASDADVLAAARAANADGFIQALPDGYATALGERAASLSGGQRQRLAIARAILRDAPVLLLDEATSALDSESEQLIQAAVDTLSEGRTTLVIAHRLATVRSADRIIVLENGRVVDTGRHEDLLRRGGLYARYVELQFGQDVA